MNYGARPVMNALQWNWSSLYFPGPLSFGSSSWAQPSASLLSQGSIGANPYQLFRGTSDRNNAVILDEAMGVHRYEQSGFALGSLWWWGTNLGHWATTTTQSAARLGGFEAAKVAIEQFAGLNRNWDGYGGAAISEQARVHARRFLEVIAAAPMGLPAPDVSPTPSGTISMEWETDNTEAYFEIGNTRYSGYIKTEGQQPIYFEGRADALDQQIVAVIRDALFPVVVASSTITEIHFSEPGEQRLAA